MDDWTRISFKTGQNLDVRRLCADVVADLAQSVNGKAGNTLAAIRAVHSIVLVRVDDIVYISPSPGPEIKPT